jgi:hypothetical protein
VLLRTGAGSTDCIVTVHRLTHAPCTNTVVASLSVTSADEGFVFVFTGCLFIHTHTHYIHTHYDPSSADAINRSKFLTRLELKVQRYWPQPEASLWRVATAAHPTLPIPSRAFATTPCARRRRSNSGIESRQVFLQHDLSQFSSCNGSIL